MDKLTFVTVMFEAEYPLLELQARSMDRNLSSDLVEEIIVIDNSDRDIGPSIRAEIRACYGRLSHLLRIIGARDLCTFPLTAGWYKQQIAKLLIANEVNTKFYVTLDAKNHFISNANGDFFVDNDERPCVNFYSFKDHPLRSKLEHVLKYLNLDPRAYIECFTATVTPYTFRTAWVQELTKDIGRGDPDQFAKEFAAHELTEFFLYAGWIIKGGHHLKTVFNLHQRFCASIWPAEADPAGTNKKIIEAASSDSPMFSVHRNALNKMPGPSIALLVNFWVERGLFVDIADAERFVSRFRTNLKRRSAGLRIRSLPYELSRFPRRVIGRLRRWREQR